MRLSKDYSASVGLLEQSHRSPGLHVPQEFLSDSVPEKTRRRGWASCLWVGLGIAILWTSVFGLSLYAKAPQGGRASCSCGSNLLEARSLGCKYDSLAAAWLPPACRDEENTAEFEKRGPGPDGAWIYYTDWDKTGTLTLAEVEELPDSHGHFFTTHEWHIQHCLYIWRKIWRAPSTGVTIEGNIDTDAHTKHCGDMFMKRVALDLVVTGSGVTLNADHVEEHKGH